MAKVFAKIPKTGLGNCMLLWAHALVFAKINKMELVVGRWERFRWGAILRREKKKRRYKGYFIESPLMKLILLQLELFFSKKYFDPEIEIIYPQRNFDYYIFQNPFPRRELFKYLAPHEEMIKDELFRILSPALAKKVAQCKSPEIAIHVRRGDFKFGNPITSNEFFISAIRNIREALNQDLEVMVFTDAEENEISDILALGNVSLSKNKEDILDILQMSKGRFLVLSLSSSFSYWAAFLSKAFVIMSTDDWQKRIKPDGEGYREVRCEGIKNEIEKEINELGKLNIR